MNCIEHIVDPRRLFLVWQPSLGVAARRTRRVVAEIIRGDSDSGAAMRYLDQTEDFRSAMKEGFQGYPAFRLHPSEHHRNVLDAFMRRLPPRSRGDFGEYLQAHRLPVPFVGSDMALLAYTGARLPSDGFEIIPDFEGARPPLEIVLEVVGIRHHPAAGDRQIAPGDAVLLMPENDNQHDPQAVAVMHGDVRIGYVARPVCRMVRAWLSNHTVTACVDRLNGKPERPVAYLFVQVR